MLYFKRPLGTTPAPSSEVSNTIRDLTNSLNTGVPYQPPVQQLPGTLPRSGPIPPSQLLPPNPPGACVLLPRPQTGILAAGKPAYLPITIGNCVWDGASFCNPASANSIQIGQARAALRAFFGSRPIAPIFVRSNVDPSVANLDAYDFLRQTFPEFPWTSTKGNWQIQAYVRPMINTTQAAVSTTPVSGTLGLWLLYPTDSIPAEFMDPAHPPFNGADQPYGLVAPGQADTGPMSQALAAAMFMFYPAGKVDFGGSAPGTIHPSTLIGSYFGGKVPSAYWARTVSTEMIDFMTRFLTQPNPYDGQIGFGAANQQLTAGAVALQTGIDALVGASLGQRFLGQQQTNYSNQSVAAGSAAAANTAAAAGVAAGAGGVPGFAGMGAIGAVVGAQQSQQSAGGGAAAAAGTAAAAGSVFGPYGAAIGAGIGATIGLISGLWGAFSDPDPPGWVKQLSKMAGLMWQTGAWYWVGQQPYGVPTQAQAGFCTRLWPMNFRGQVPVDPTLDFNSRAWPIHYTIPTTSSSDYTIFQPRSGPNDPLWTPMEAYAELMRRIGKGTGVPSTSTIPTWVWWALGGVAIVGGGALLLGKKKEAA